jgi:hypothetical protein
MELKDKIMAEIEALYSWNYDVALVWDRTSTYFPTLLNFVESVARRNGKLPLTLLIVDPQILPPPLEKYFQEKIPSTIHPQILKIPAKCEDLSVKWIAHKKKLKDDQKPYNHAFEYLVPKDPKKVLLLIHSSPEYKERRQAFNLTPNLLISNPLSPYTEEELSEVTLFYDLAPRNYFGPFRVPPDFSWSKMLFEYRKSLVFCYPRFYDKNKNHPVLSKAIYEAPPPILRVNFEDNPLRTLSAYFLNPASPYNDGYSFRSLRNAVQKYMLLREKDLASERYHAEAFLASI